MTTRPITVHYDKPGAPGYDPPGVPVGVHPKTAGEPGRALGAPLSEIGSPSEIEVRGTRPKKKYRTPAYRAGRLRNQARAEKKAKEQVFRVLGVLCARCGFSDVRALQVDHVHGDGRKEGRGSRYWRRVLRSVLAGEGRFQVLCANCNWIKRDEDFSR